MTEQIPDDLEDAPPSAKCVYQVLRDLDGDGAIPSTEITDRSGLPRRTVVDGVAALRDRDLLEEHPDPADPRRQLYRLQFERDSPEP